MKLDYFGYRKTPPEERIRPASLVVGKSDYLQGLVADDLLDRALQAADRGMNLATAEALTSSPLDLAALLDDLRTPTLLGGPRVLHLKAIENLDKNGRRLLEEYIARPGQGAFLILQGKMLRANTRLFRTIQDRGLIVQCRPLYATPPPWGGRGGTRESELAGWIRLRTEDRGRRITAKAVQAAVEAWGTDLAAIDGALEQASTLLEETQEIGEEVIQSLAPASRADPVYRVVDELLLGRQAVALGSLRAVFTHGLADAAGRGRDNPGGIAQILIRGLHGKFISLWRAHLLREEGKTEEEILKALGVAPFLADRFKEQMAANPLEGIPDRLGVILEVERSIKTGEAEPMAAAEGMILRLGSRPRSGLPGRSR